MCADWLASVHMHEFKPSLVTKLPRMATKNKFACPIRAAARLCEGGFGPPKIGSHRRDRRPPAPPLVAAGEIDSGTPQVGGCPRTLTCTLMTASPRRPVAFLVQASLLTTLARAHSIMIHHPVVANGCMPRAVKVEFDVFVRFPSGETTTLLSRALAGWFWPPPTPSEFEDWVRSNWKNDICKCHDMLSSDLDGDYVLVVEQLLPYTDTEQFRCDLPHCWLCRSRFTQCKLDPNTTSPLCPNDKRKRQPIFIPAKWSNTPCAKPAFILTRAAEQEAMPDLMLFKVTLHPEDF